MSRWLKGLNPEQREAVRTVKGPLLVLAGAGSGKTLVITRRIAYMIEKGTNPENILAVTFTNKAAAEMKTRLLGMAGKAAERVTLSTFHSLGLMMLRKELALKKRRAGFVIFDQGDQLSCLRELNRNIRLERSFDLGAILARISHYKNSFLNPEEIESGDDPYEQAGAVFYPAYLQAMEAYSAVDFDDLICRPTLMMERSDSCRKRWANRFRYVLVDEYQDTNAAQLRMLRAIAGKHRNLCVVGDDDQSIYGWRGAQVRNILQFERDFRKCRVIYLMRNYRSVATVLDLANQVIARNEKRHPKELVADRHQGTSVKMIVHEDGASEATWVADRVETLVDKKRYRMSEVAVLYRSAVLARGLETAFRSARLPYRVLGGKSFFERKEVKDLVAYLKLCANPADSISLRRVINWPARGIGPTTLSRLAAWADERDQPLFKALDKANEILAPSDRARKAVAGFRSLINEARKDLRQGRNLMDGVNKLVDSIGMHQDVLSSAESGNAAERRWANVTGFLDGLTVYCRDSAKPSLRDFLNQISLNELDDDSDDDPGNKITLSTLHGAKGLEFPLVFLVGMEEGFLPHDRVVNPHATDVIGSDVSEERRLCYVGITRARDELILSRAAQRLVNGRMSERAPSRFISDLPEGLFDTEDRTQTLSPEEARKKLAAIRQMLDS